LRGARVFAVVARGFAGFARVAFFARTAVFARRPTVAVAAFAAGERP
jgi:hypothetical protein